MCFGKRSPRDKRRLSGKSTTSGDDTAAPTPPATDLPRSSSFLVASSTPSRPEEPPTILAPRQAQPDTRPATATMPAKRGRKKKGAGYFSSNSNGGGAGAASKEAALDKMFDELRDLSRDSNDAISAESTMAYLADLGVDMENAEMFVALELVQAPSFGEITRTGFVEGWKAAGASASQASQQQTIRSRVTQLGTDPAYFKKVYRHTFVACKEPEQRALSLENALVFWEMIFSPPGRPWQTANHDWLKLWKEFLGEKWTRSVNKDMWNQTLEFASKTMDDETLGFWSEDGAWPGVIDDFVAWYRARDAMDTDS